VDAEEKRFIEWLRKQPKTRHFETRNNDHCPLAAYYQEVWSLKFAQSIDFAWQRQFMYWFDRGPYSPGPMFRTLDGVEQWIDAEERFGGLPLPTY